ncbi:MAG: GNAT family N-acetyltransferase, partial [Gammaproteobacteria bacterium]
MSRISLRAVPFDDPDARALVSEFYADQLTRYDRADSPADDPSDYAPPQGLFLLLYVDNQPVGCGGYRGHDTTTGEIKRVYVRPEHRGRGHGRRILTALEDHGRSVGATCLLLETG